MRLEGQVSRKRGRGGELWLSETELRGKFTIGRGGLTSNALREPPRGIQGHAPQENF